MAAAAAGVLAGHQPGVAHELPSAREASQRAPFADQRGGGHRAHAAQRGEGADQGLLGRRQRGERRGDRQVEPADPLRQEGELAPVVVEDHLERRQREAQASQPLRVPGGPGRHPLGAVLPMPQEELPDAMARAALILLGCLPGADQIAQRLGGRIGDPDGGEVAGAVAAGEPDGVLAVGLHSIARLRGHEAGRDDVAVHAQGGELPVERVAGGTGFVADAERVERAEFAEQLPDGFGAMPNLAQLAHPAIRFRDRDRNRFGMDIEAHVPHHGLRHSDRLRRVVALASRPIRLANPRYHDRGPVASF